MMPRRHSGLLACVLTEIIIMIRKLWGSGRQSVKQKQSDRQTICDKRCWDTAEGLK